MKKDLKMDNFVYKKMMNTIKVSLRRMKFIQKNHKIHRIIILKKISYKLKLRVKGQDIKN
jgi:hypothetical protein